MVPNNIVKGFKVTGFVPFNEDIFTEDEFLPATVTDRPMPQETPITPENPRASEKPRHHQTTFKIGLSALTTCPQRLLL